MFELVEKHKIDAAQVRKVDIGLSQTAFDLHGGYSTYKAKFEALLSAHYTAAAILHDHALTLAQFEPRRYDDAKLRSFAAEKVEIRPDASVSGSQAKVTITMADGAKLSAFCQHPLGGKENPLSRAQVENKFRTYAEGVLPPAHIADVIGAVDRIEDFGSIRQLMTLLRGAAKTTPRAMAAAE